MRPAGRVLVLLSLLIIVTLVLGGAGPMALASLAILASLLANELDRCAPRLARGLVRRAVRPLPYAQRSDQLDEWLDHVRAAGEAGLPPLLVAMSILTRAAPKLALRGWLHKTLDKACPASAQGGLLGSAWNKYIYLDASRRVGFSWVQREYQLHISLRGELTLTVRERGPNTRRGSRVASWVGWDFAEVYLLNELTSAVAGPLRRWNVNVAQLANLLLAAQVLRD